MPNNAKVKAWWQVFLALGMMVATVATAQYGAKQFSLYRDVSIKMDELTGKIAELKDKGIKTDELEKVLEEFKDN